MLFVKMHGTMSDKSWFTEQYSFIIFQNVILTGLTVKNIPHFAALD